MFNNLVVSFKKPRLWCCILAIILFPSLALANNAASKISIKKGENYTLCRDLYSILQLPENMNYIQKIKKNSVRSNIMADIFFVPAENKTLRLPKWESASKEKFCSRMSTFCPKYGEGKLRWGIDYQVKEASIDIDNDGHRDLLFKIYFNFLNANRVRMPEVPHNEVDASFNSVSADNIPFFYKGRVYFSRRFTPSTLEIIEGGSLRSNNTQETGDNKSMALIQTKICHFVADE